MPSTWWVSFTPLFNLQQVIPAWVFATAGCYPALWASKSAAQGYSRPGEKCLGRNANTIRLDHYEGLRRMQEEWPSLSSLLGLQSGGITHGTPPVAIFPTMQKEPAWEWNNGEGSQLREAGESSVTSKRFTQAWTLSKVSDVYDRKTLKYTA